MLAHPCGLVAGRSSCKKKDENILDKVYQVSKGKGQSVNTSNGLIVNFFDISDQRCMHSICSTCLPNVAFTKIISKDTDATTVLLNYQGCYKCHN